MSSVCPYCGQASISGDSEIDALQNCTCSQARSWRALQEQKTIAKNHIAQICFLDAENQQMPVIDDEELIDYFEKAIDFIADGKINDISINLTQGGKIKIRLGSENSITIKRAVGHSAELKAGIIK
ncbi:MAG: hypothetical protein KBT46_01245 [Ruminococcus sp.]|nr:hypothetical protein [Candidatus Copronaster equi]